MATKLWAAVTILALALIGSTIGGQVSSDEPVICYKTDGKEKPYEWECEKNCVCFATSDGAKGCKDSSGWKRLPAVKAICQKKDNSFEFLCADDHCNDEDAPEVKDCMAGNL